MYPRNTYEKKFRTHEIPTRKNFGPTQYRREKNLDPQNTQKRKNFEPTKYPQGKNLDPRNTNEKNLDPRNTHEKKVQIHEILVRKILDLRNTHVKKFGSTKYPKEKKLPTHKKPTRKTFWIHEGTVTRWHETHDCTRPTEFSTLFFLIHIKLMCNASNLKLGFHLSSKRLLISKINTLSIILGQRKTIFGASSIYIEHCEHVDVTE